MPYGGYGSTLDPMAAPGAAARYGGYADLFSGRVAGAQAPGEVGSFVTTETGEVGQVVAQNQLEVQTVVVGRPQAAAMPAPVVMAPAPVVVAPPPMQRVICFKRWQKLLFFGVLFIIAMIIIICLYVLSLDALRITIVVLAALTAVLLGAEYLVLGVDCSINPTAGTMSCPKMFA